MAVPNIEPPEIKDRTVVDGLIVAAVILGIAGVLIVGRHAVDDDRAEASEVVVTTTEPQPLEPAETTLWAHATRVDDAGRPTELRVTVARGRQDLVGGTVSVAGAPCKVGVSIAAGDEVDVVCPVAAPADTGAPESVTVRVTDQRGTDESLVVPLTVSAPS